MRPSDELLSFSLLGRRFFAGSLEEAQAWLLKASKEPRAVCVANVHTLVLGLFDTELGQAQSEAALSLPDGKPLSLAGKLEGCWQAAQLRGPDLMLSLAQAGVAAKARHYYFGGHPGAAKKAAQRLGALVPGLQVSGVESPPFRELSDAELKALIGRLKRTRTTHLWVGIGAPRQEKLMARLARLGAPCAMVGVGAGFDYYAGTKPEAPRWMMALSLEWLFRLGSEPGRLWKRYLGTNPVFLCLLLAEHFGLYPGSEQGLSERLLRLACLPPLLEAAAQGRAGAALLSLLMPSWLGRLFFLAKH